jgi:membrane-associated phospholipid phosphatase
VTRRLMSMLFAAVVTISSAAQAEALEQSVVSESTSPGSQSVPDSTLTSSITAEFKAYFTAPLHWDSGDWAWFGGSLVAIGAAHHYDTQVRTHFIKTEGPTVGSNSYDLQDAIPALAVLAGTWFYAGLTDSSAGHRESWTMLEAASLSTVTTYVIKFASRRERPNQTSDPNAWGKSGGDSFPSQHATFAFAVGTVMAESGNDEFRWVRRLLGYGLGAATSYERLKHNTHWLSDTVAGAAVGISTAHFAMHQREGINSENGLVVIPLQGGGAMLTYRLTLN